MTNVKFKRSLIAATIGAAVSLMSVPALAGNTHGAIKGSIASNSQAVAGATVTVLNKATGLKRSVTANENGSYRLPNLPIGKYKVTITKTGFETIVFDNVATKLGGQSTLDAQLVSGDVERISVMGGRMAAIDTSSTEVALNIGEAQIDRLPISRDITSVALLAPNTTKGDGRFGNFAAFGGSSVAENAVFINGLNVTNFRNGLGFSNVPFEFYEQFQVKTGGYSAEFGRSTGGVINAVTKSGTNEFKFGGDIYITPDALRGESPDTIRTNGNAYDINSQRDKNSLNGNIYASGPIIEDKLFFYAIYNPRNNTNDFSVTDGSKFSEYENTSDFWGAKVDWQISENHLLEILAFSDKTEGITASYGYDWKTETKGAKGSTSFDNSGGDNFSVTYTGQLSDDLTLKVLYGENKYNLSSFTDVDEACTAIFDTRDVATEYYAGCTSSASVTVGDDKREQLRVDFEYAGFDDHVIRFGYDTETNSSYSSQKYSGPNGNYIVVSDATPGGILRNGGVVPAGVTVAGNSRVRTVGGAFETENSAFYIEDTWTISDNVVASIGLRYDEFTNSNPDGKAFVEVSDMIAPRIGVTWDINGDGESKLFANIGRYFLPVANNTNVRLSGNESDKRTYHEIILDQSKIGTNGYATLGQQIGEVVVNADGNVPDTRAIVDQNLDAMYQDELIVGYVGTLNDDWTYGVTTTFRSLNGAIDDMYLGANGFTGADGTACKHGDYVLGNPGEDVTALTDSACFTTSSVNGDGETVKKYNHGTQTVETFSTAALGYPTAERKYVAADFNVTRAWDDVWQASLSYTWAHSYGNSEGLVKSDNAQADAGLTTDFDFSELMDGAYGNLPNDRRHAFKMFGAYALTENLTIGANFTLESGRPTNALGIGHPDGIPNYGATYYLCTTNCNDENEATNKYYKSTRGSYGRTPWTSTIDLSATYTMDVAGADVRFKAKVNNLLDASSVTRVNETAEITSPGTVNPTFGLPTSFQAPRSVTLSASFDF